jgi:hypothetical protein
MHQRRDLRKVVELCIVSNFVEAYLAREGHRCRTCPRFTAPCWPAWAMS